MPKIVLVEDEELIATMVELNLRREGFEVSSFDNAEEALAHLEDASCDAILLDIMLPGMNGPEALRTLRQSGVKTPVLMLTARHDLDLKVGTLEDGADDYLTKPFDMDELLARIRVLLRRVD
jgi:DNA-binding response OmpR family regulator